MHDAEAEQSLIGAVLLHNEIFGAVGEKLTAADFFEGIHAEIWDILGKLIGAGKRADPRSITPFLPADLKIGEMPIKKYLARLAAEGAIPNHVPQLADMIRDHSDRRAMAEVASELGKAQGGDPSELAKWAVEQLDGILGARATQDSPSLSLQASVVRAVEAAAKAYQDDGAMTGMSYGLRDLDTKLGGLHKGEITLLAGRPGMMKTGIALNFIRDLCSVRRNLAGTITKPAYRGIMFSLEMGDVLLTQRLMADIIFGEDRTIELSYSKIRRGQITEKEFEYITQAGRTLAKLPLQIEQQGGITLSEIGAKARSRQRREGLDFIVVDYIGLMGVADRYRGNRVSEIAELSSGFIKLAKELNVAMLVLCQLNRLVEAREDKRPRLSDLRESGALEQDASVVIMLYREAYYLQNREPRPGTPEYEKWQMDMLACWDKIEIQIEKNRNGPTGMIEAYVNPAVNAVRDLSFDHSPQRAF